MRPMRSMGGGGFGFAGVESMAAKLAIALVAGSVISLAAGQVGSLLLLAPQGVLGNFWLWQPFTYAFVERSPLGIIFGALILYSIGGGLEMTWGSRRLLWTIWGGTVLAGVLTVLTGLVLPVQVAYSGGGVMTTLAWVSYGLSIGRGQANFWGLPLSGYWLAAIGAGFVVLNALTAGVASQIPEIFALGLAWLAVNAGSPRRLMLRAQHWRMQRQMRGRSKHLKVLSRERDTERPNDRYLN